MRYAYLLFIAFFFFATTPSAHALTAICESYVSVTLPNGACEITLDPNWIDGGSYDPAGRPLTFSVSPRIVGLGDHNVWLTVSNGVSTNRCWSRVTTVDRSLPNLNCEPVNIYLVAPDQEYLSDPSTWYNLSDDCGVENLRMNVPDIAGFGSGIYTVSFDHVSGNSGACAMPITIHDAEPQNYCNGSRNASYEHIARVRLTGGSNNLWLSSGDDGGYRWHYNHGTATMYHGSTYTVHLRPGFRSGSPYRLYWRTYLDKNGDGDFTDAGELLNQWNGTGDHSFSFTSPGTFWGMSRIRVVMSYGGYATPCSGRWGEVEDISVLLRPYFFIPWPWGQGVETGEEPFAAEMTSMRRPDEPWSPTERMEERQWPVLGADAGAMKVVEAEEVTLYPNPLASGTALFLRGISGPTEIEVYNTLGARVAGLSVRRDGPTARLQMPHLPAGTYLLRGTSGEVDWTRRLVIR